MTYQPDVVFIGLPHSGSTLLRSYFEHHPDLTWARTAGQFMRANFDPAAYQAQQRPVGGKVFIDVYELLAINFLVPPDPLDLEKVRFTLNANLMRQEFPTGAELIPSRIKETLPHARIIFVLRSQLTWLRSHYLYHIQNLPTGQRKFTDYLNCLDGKRITSAGHFHHTISAYQETFGKDNVHLLLLEQIIQDFPSALKSLCEFLGVDYVDFPREKQDRHTGKSPISGTFIRGLSSFGFSGRAARRFAPLYRPLVQGVSKVYKPGVLSRDEVALITAVFSRSNYHASQLSGIDLSEYGYPL